MTMKYTGGFECDKAAKNILKDLIENVWFSSCTIVFDEENEMNEYATMDMLFTAYTTTGHHYAYAIELKERKGYNHSDFTEWMIETHKLNDMKRYRQFGYKCFYFNLFKDGIYYLWNYDTIAENHKEALIPIKPHTQGEDTEEKVKQTRIMIDAKDIVLSGTTNQI